MKLIEALLMEVAKIQEDDNMMPNIRDDFTDMMICVRFKGGQKHYILPSKERMEEFLKELNGIVLHNKWHVIAENTRRMTFDPLIEKEDFKVE